MAKMASHANMIAIGRAWGEFLSKALKIKHFDRCIEKKNTIFYYKVFTSYVEQNNQREYFLSINLCEFETNIKKETDS